jgi:hypothetical protein
MTPNFMKIYQSVQKLLAENTETDRQTGDLISPLSFLENRLNMYELLQKLLVGTY